MQPHPDFAGRMPPRTADLGLFLLTPLGPDSAEEDFAVVTRSAHVLTRFFGSSWPAGLTLAADRIDLAWHEREFTACRSFAWILRDREGVYLGCAYVSPDLGERLRGQVYLWLADGPDRVANLGRFRAVLADWLAPQLPPGGIYGWHVNDGAMPS